jgi:N-acetylmuramoyl-L-alanine amidase
LLHLYSLRFCFGDLSGTQHHPAVWKKKARRVILNSASRERSLQLLAVFVCLAVASPLAHARTRHSDAWAREHFSTAERMREALNGRNPSDRTRRAFERVVNAYRLVYLGAPNSSKADPSVVAVAETMVEMGRRFNDEKILNKAIEEYKFLRREYPGSKYRFDGLFTIGEIYKDDLNNPEQARATFEEFLRRYPRNHLAEDARQAIANINATAETDKLAQAQGTTGKTSREEDKDHGGGSASVAAGGRTPGFASKKEELSTSASRLPRVTGIRHWSTPTYTRVAIDLEGEAKFSSQRIASPARIFFDLKETKLASTLVGKSFDVEDGFLKKVRVSQFEPGRTRVVLDVENLSEYDAFLLPNPYRLIIDIHGKKGAKRLETEPGRTQTVDETETAPPSQSESASQKAKSVVPADANSAVLPPSSSATDARTQSGAPKKIVDADDEAEVASGAEAAEVAVPKHAKKISSHDGIVVDKVAKADEEDLSQPSDLTPASGAANGTSASRRKSTSRALASGKSQSSYDLDVREARPTAAGDRSLIRALGLKIGKIVIDPGHGGHDTGTIGPNGLEEKDLVLEVGRRLGKLLETRLGAEVVYTRRDDTFIPLETRTAIANQARADLFISIHANSSHDPDARGVETYYLNFTSSPEALDVAARENAVSEKSIYELQDLVKKIALKEKIEESREFAGDVQASLHSGLAVKSPAIRDRGVKKAPFIVLIGANMPSILAEISFVSNPTDEHRLATSDYRERIAESLYRGIARYVNGLSGVKVASKMDKGAAQ